MPKGIEAETFKQLSRENMPPMPPPGGRGGRGAGPPGGPGGPGGPGFGGDERWQSGRMPSGAAWLGMGGLGELRGAGVRNEPRPMAAPAAAAALAV